MYVQRYLKQRRGLARITWQKSEHFSETVKYPLSFEHRKSLAKSMKLAS